MVKVRGNIDNLQSSIDFYLNITSKEEVLESRFMRDKFFAIFDKENSYRKENFLVYKEVISDNYKVNTDVEPKLSGDEEEYDFGCCYFNNLDKGKKGGEVYNEVGTKKVSIEDEKKNSVIENLRIEKEDDSDEFIIHDYTENEDEVEDDLFSQWATEEDDDLVDDIGWGEDFLSEDVTVEADEGELLNEGLENFEGGINRPSKENAIPDEKYVGSSEFEVDINFFDGYFDGVDDSVGGATKNLIVETPIKNTQEITEIPKDLRDFVKMYPNCELSFVYKYFTKKEVDRQLSMGRVFKRKNKLLI